MDTGPTYDHTYGTSYGRYMYIETSSPRVKGDVARFISGEYQQMSGDECVTFYYHMYGKDTGTLNVYQFDGKYTQGLFE